VTNDLDLTERECVVAVDGVWKLFAMGDEVVRALVDVSFAVQRGEFLCLMGPSGSGKSTVLHLLGGLDRPTKGEISISGSSTSGLTENQFSALRRSKIGFIFQSYNLIPFLSALENVELPLTFEPLDRQSVRKRAVDLLELVGLGHRLHHRRRVCRAASSNARPSLAPIGSPALILADEPTANLDQRSGERSSTCFRSCAATSASPSWRPPTIRRLPPRRRVSCVWPMVA
jgi:putative ABC transport system ATP-binding protein